MDYLQPYIPILLLLAIAIGFALVTLVLSSLIGPVRLNKAKLLAYECGNEPFHEANIRIPIKFYLVALLFLLFDMETVLVLMWAVAFRGSDIAGWQPYAFGVMTFFMAILVVGFLYEWKKGALEWH